MRGYWVTPMGIDLPQYYLCEQNKYVDMLSVHIKHLSQIQKRFVNFQNSLANMKQIYKYKNKFHKKKKSVHTFN